MPFAPTTRNRSASHSVKSNLFKINKGKRSRASSLHASKKDGQVVSKTKTSKSTHRPTFSRSLGSATFRALYPEQSSKTSISHLDPHEMIWLGHCLKSPTSWYYTEEELLQRTKLIITSLPKHLRNPLGNSDQAQITRFFRKIGASADTLPIASSLCPAHHALSGQLTASARSLVEFCAEDLMYDLKNMIGRKALGTASDNTLTLLEQAENVMGFTLEPEEFYKTYHRQLPNHFQPGKHECDACVLKEIVSCPDMLCGLRGVALLAFRNGIGTDDRGTERARPCKTFVEACIATYAKDDAILLCNISDGMAAEMELLAELNPLRTTDNKAHQRSKSEANTQAAMQSPDLMPSPLTIGGKTGCSKTLVSTSIEFSKNDTNATTHATQITPKETVSNVCEASTSSNGTLPSRRHSKTFRAIAKTLGHRKEDPQEGAASGSDNKRRTSVKIQSKPGSKRSFLSRTASKLGSRQRRDNFTQNADDVASKPLLVHAVDGTCTTMSTRASDTSTLGELPSIIKPTPSNDSGYGSGSSEKAAGPWDAMFNAGVLPFPHSRGSL